MPVICGFDPGLSGAATAILIEEMGGIELIDIIDLPTRPDGTKRIINVPTLGRWLENISPDAAWIENVQPMRGKGGDSQGMPSAGAFRFGMACGALRGALEAYQIPVHLVTAQSWKRAYGLKGSDKEQSRQMALKMLPAALPHLKRKLDHNRAESLLVALYGANHGRLASAL